MKRVTSYSGSVTGFRMVLRAIQMQAMAGRTLTDPVAQQRIQKVANKAMVMERLAGAPRGGWAA